VPEPPGGRNDWGERGNALNFGGKVDGEPSLRRGNQGGSETSQAGHAKHIITSRSCLARSIPKNRSGDPNAAEKGTFLERGRRGTTDSRRDNLDEMASNKG